MFINCKNKQMCELMCNIIMWEDGYVYFELFYMSERSYSCLVVLIATGQYCVGGQGQPVLTGG